jgi:DNA-binding CsgD family transcriptional regulator
LAVAPQSTGELLEREAELATLAGLLDRAAGGVGAVLLIEGDAGVGKTRLLDAVEELSSELPVRVLRARGGELERSFPFGIAAQLLSPPVAALGAQARRSVLSGAAALAAPLVDPRATGVVSAAGSQEALFAQLHGLYWLCAGLAAPRPLLLVVDDAHWADEPSLRWLLFMARRLGDMPLSLVLGARPATAGDWPEPLVLLSGEPRVAVARPRPLSERASAVVVRRTVGENAEEAFCRACHASTGGNPFLLSELIAAVKADGVAATEAGASEIESVAPEAIGRSVIVRLGRLAPEAGALARAIAVLGAEAELRHAAQLADLELAGAAAAADALVKAGLLNTGRPLRLAHPVVRTALYFETREGERAQLHRRAARMLAAEDADVDAVAAHLLAADPDNEDATIEVLQQAADRALARGAPGSAVRYLKRALAEPPRAAQRVAVLRGLGVAEGLSGDRAAEDSLREAMRLAAAPGLRAEIALELSSAYVLTGRFGEAIRALEQAIDETVEPDQELRWRLESRLIATAHIETAHRTVAERHLQTLPLGLPGDTPGERLILAQLAYAAAIGGDPVDVVVALATGALANGRLVAEEPPLSPSLLEATFALVLGEQSELAMSAYDQWLSRAQREGAPIAFALVCSQRSQLHCYRGQIADAIAEARNAIDANSHFGWDVGAPSLYANLINASLEAGELAAAEQALADSGVPKEIPEMLAFCDMLPSRARLRLAQGDMQAGIDEMLLADQLLARFGQTNPAGKHCRSTAAVALASIGQREQAQGLVADELAAARRFGAPGTVGTSLRAAGMIEGGSIGIELLREAVALLERSPARLEHARALGDLGGALRRSGHRREAQQTLRQALDLADRCGGKVVAEQARAELLITGARPRRARLDGVEALTASERRVAQLAAEGLTNRQIAQALFVSHPTVVTHLSHCYQKLNISTREQLTSALAGAPPANNA